MVIHTKEHFMFKESPTTICICLLFFANFNAFTTCWSDMDASGLVETLLMS